MNITSNYPYTEIINWDERLPLKSVTLVDHIGGFDQAGNNLILERIDQVSKHTKEAAAVRYHNILADEVQLKYSNIIFKFDADLQNRLNFVQLLTYNIHPTINFKNFICSFNGSAHVSRKLLVSIIEKFRWFCPTYCSKNFSYSTEVLDGHISDYVGNSNNFYRKFFIDNNSEEFFQTVNSFGHLQYDHKRNIYNLESKLTENFLHIVSETAATSYYPFVTEKFLYSVVTRGLFLAYAQPGWHSHLEKYYGFKRYTKLFDYRFDTIENPVERLIELMSMIAKFSVLSIDDWQNLYEMEKDTIEYNYNHYFSGGYLKCLNKF